MLEARARIPGCKRLATFTGDDECFDGALLVTRIRLLQVLLPSVKTLGRYTWNQAFEPCFLEARAPYRTDFKVWLEDEEHVFSSGVLEATPAIEAIDVDSKINRPLGGAVSRPWPKLY